MTSEKGLMRCFLKVIPFLSILFYSLCGFSAAEGDFIKGKTGTIRPTQFRIGHEFMEYRKKEIQDVLALPEGEEKEKKLKKMAIDVVIGPGGVLWAVDGHHHGYAFMELGIGEVYCKVDKDWSNKTEEEFFRDMKNEDGKKDKTRMFLIDIDGKTHSEKELGKTFKEMGEDRLRSIFGFLFAIGIMRKGDGFPNHGELKDGQIIREKGINLPSSLPKAVKTLARLVSSRKSQLKLFGQVPMKKSLCADLFSRFASEMGWSAD